MALYFARRQYGLKAVVALLIRNDTCVQIHTDNSLFVLFECHMSMWHKKVMELVLSALCFIVHSVHLYA